MDIFPPVVRYRTEYIFAAEGRGAAGQKRCPLTFQWTFFWEILTTGKNIFLLRKREEQRRRKPQQQGLGKALPNKIPMGQNERTANYGTSVESCSDSSHSAPAVKLRISPSAAYNDRKGILPKNVDNFFEKMGVKKRLAMQTAQKTYTWFMRNQPEIREGRRSLCLPSLSAEKRNRLRLSMARKRLSRPLTGAACFAIFRHEWTYGRQCS